MFGNGCGSFSRASSVEGPVSVGNGGIAVGGLVIDVDVGGFAGGGGAGIEQRPAFAAIKGAGGVFRDDVFEFIECGGDGRVANAPDHGMAERVSGDKAGIAAQIMEGAADAGGGLECAGSVEVDMGRHAGRALLEQAVECERIAGGDGR